MGKKIFLKVSDSIKCYPINHFLLNQQENKIALKLSIEIFTTENKCMNSFTLKMIQILFVYYKKA